MRITRPPALAVLAVLFCVFLSACEAEQQEKASAGKPVIGVLVFREDDIYIGLVTQAIQKNLQDKAEVEVLYAEQDQLVQNEQIDALIKKKVNALAVNIVETQAAAKAVDSIKKAGIPVVFFNREPDLRSLKAYADARFVGTNAFDAGIMQGDIIVELWDKHPEFDKNGDGKCQYLMIQANLDNPEAVARTEYSVKRAREKGLTMQQAGDTLLCNWEENMAFAAVKLMLPSQIDTIELIIANNDAMALGAIKALNELEYNLGNGLSGKYIPVVGVDAVPRAVEAIKQGKMSGTVIQDGNAMGFAVSTMILNAVQGKDFLEGLPYSWDDSGIAVRVPYSRYTGGQ